ncbi:hypothetical protein [Tateyamaria sp.]|uniref:hypothetical protein n=1 Tax=Tateyamaria sp. TaxID=1929288 RepID=UPI003B221010
MNPSTDLCNKATGAGILFASLIARGLDETLCAQWAIGTHFLWHILNAIMLGWMIEVYRRYVVASQRPVQAVSET